MKCRWKKTVLEGYWLWGVWNRLNARWSSAALSAKSSPLQEVQLAAMVPCLEVFDKGVLNTVWHSLCALFKPKNSNCNGDRTGTSTASVDAVHCWAQGAWTQAEEHTQHIYDRSCSGSWEDAVVSLAAVGSTFSSRNSGMPGSHFNGASIAHFLPRRKVLQLSTLVAAHGHVVCLRWEGGQGMGFSISGESYECSRHTTRRTYDLLDVAAASFWERIQGERASDNDDSTALYWTEQLASTADVGSLPVFPIRWKDRGEGYTGEEASGAHKDNATSTRTGDQGNAVIFAWGQVRKGEVAAGRISDTFYPGPKRDHDTTLLQKALHGYKSKSSLRTIR